MSSISTSIGLASGFPIEDFVNAMIAIEKRPITLLQQRVAKLDSQRTAFLQIEAQLLAIRNAAVRFSTASFFAAASATSSNEKALLATASSGAATGQYTFTVKNLASSHQLITSGFASRDASPVGAGTFTIESAAGTVNQATQLSELNAGAGVRAGRIVITDRTGGRAQLDLRTALTIDDVVAAINNQTDAGVRARVEGDRLVIEDQTGATTGQLRIEEYAGGRTAADLGILGSSSTGIIMGGDLVSIAEDTRLATLNDGNGVRTVKSLNDFSAALADGTVLSFDLSAYVKEDTPLSVLNNGAGVPAGQIKLTNSDGLERTVDLSSAETIGDVISAIQTAAPEFSVTLSGSRLLINDSTDGDGTTKIEEVNGGTTAAALGIAKTTTGSSIKGDDIFFVRTVGDVVRIINSNPDNSDGVGGYKLTASVSGDGKGLTLTDHTTGSGAFEVTALNGSSAAEDLGILGTGSGGSLESRRLVSSLSSVLLRSLNGGRGIGTGEIGLTDRAGVTATIDLSGANSLSDVIAAINAASTQITARVSSSGLGIELEDTSGGSGNLIVEDVSGSAAADLGIAFNGASSKVSATNLQRQYVSRATQLSEFNGGVPAGKFKIFDSNGKSAVVDLTQGDEKTLRDVISEINSRGLAVNARINDTGDGLLIEDTGAGTASLKIEEVTGSTAKALGILGTIKEGETAINGTLESRIVIGANDSLETVLDKIKKSGASVNAVIINDGAGTRPYRLSLTSASSGLDGRLAIDSGTTSLNFETLIEAQDATVLFGPPDSSAPVVLRSSSNTLSEAIAGVRLELISASEDPVTVTVKKDTSSITKDLSSFVTAFNAVVTTLDSATSYDPETEARGILQADSTASRVRSSLFNLVNKTVSGQPTSYNRLSSVGITLKSGGSLSFDQQKFLEAMEKDPEAVAALFATEDTGFGSLIQDEIDRFTDNDTGVLSLRAEAIAQSEDLLNNRIDSLNVLLERKRDRMYAEFQAMETAISQLQAQQSSLSGLSSLLSSLRSGSSG